MVQFLVVLDGSGDFVADSWRKISKSYFATFYFNFSYFSERISGKEKGIIIFNPGLSKEAGRK